MRIILVPQEKQEQMQEEQTILKGKFPHDGQRPESADLKRSPRAGLMSKDPQLSTSW